MRKCSLMIPSCINLPFRRLSKSIRQVGYALLTRAPVAISTIASGMLPLDLHVLSLQLAFILSQDQTLHCNNIFFSTSKLISAQEPNLSIIQLTVFVFLNTLYIIYNAQTCTTCLFMYNRFKELFFCTSVIFTRKGFAKIEHLF